MMSEDISGHSPSSPMPCEAEKDCEWMPWCKYANRCLKKEDSALSESRVNPVLWSPAVAEKPTR